MKHLIIFRHFTLFLLLLISLNSYASPLGISYSRVLVSKDPSDLNGYHAALTYEPRTLIWQHVQVYFDAAYSHWWVAGNTPNNNISIYSTAPYIRFYFVKQKTLSPFVQASIGLAYLTKTHLDGRNLGMHFAFQDQLGVGIAYGPEQRFYTTVSALHYSNGALCGINAGITVPLMLNVGYRF